MKDARRLSLLLAVMVMLFGAALFFLKEPSSASASFTFNGSSISANSPIVIDDSTTISIGTSTATGIIIGSNNAPTSILGNLTVGNTVLYTCSNGDDSASLQSAITALESGATLQVNGTCLLTNPITLHSNMTLDLSGAVVIPGANILQSSNTNFAAIVSNDASNLKILNGTFQPGTSTVMCASEIIYNSTTCTSVVPARPSGSVTDAPAIFLRGGSNIIISGNTFKEFFVAVGLYDASDATIDNNYALNGNAAFAVVAQSGPVNDVQVNDNRIVSGSDDGILFGANGAYDMTNVSAVGNYIDKTGLIAGQTGALAIRAAVLNGSGTLSNVLIQSNQIMSVVDDGIGVVNANNIQVLDNFISGYAIPGSNGSAIQIGYIGFPVNTALVEGNIVVNPLGATFADPFYLQNVTNGIVTGNYGVGSMDGFGVLRIVDSTGITARGNTLDNTNPTGETIEESGSSNDNTIVGNDLHLSPGTTKVETVGSSTIVSSNSGSTNDTPLSFWGAIGIGTAAPSTTLQVAGTSSTIRIGAGNIPGCLELMDSSGNSVVNYVTAMGGTLVATTTKPSECQ